MGIILLSIMLSIILGCAAWLVLGERFPLNDEVKWPSLNNISIYTVLFVVPVYLFIFFVIG